MIVLGIMSGSSLDGLDLALCKLKNDGYELIDTRIYSLPAELQEKLRVSSEWSFFDFLNIEKSYTDFVAECVVSVQENYNNIQLVSVHGHTTYHIPAQGITHQLLNGGRLSAAINLPVCCDFRMGDIALGGTGTPLVPIAEKLLFTGYDYYLNLGGIANLSDSTKEIAFDVSPCNQLLNYAAERAGLTYDEDGVLAKKGRLQPDLYLQLSSFEYYTIPPPKSLDNNWIRKNYFPLLKEAPYSDTDILNTLCHWIADRISEQVEKRIVESTLFVTGGGAHNAFLISCLNQKLIEKNCTMILPPKELIDFKEAILMCLMGYLRFHGKENILSNITGARRDSIGGALYKV